MKKVILSLLFTSLLIFQSCKDIKEVQCTSVSKFKLNSINTEAVDADISLKIKNPNKFGFNIKQSEFDVSFSGIKIGKAKLIKTVKVAASSEDAYVFKLQTTFKNVVSLDNVMSLLQAVNQKGSVEIKGDLNVGKGMAKKKIPVNLNEKIMVD